MLDQPGDAGRDPRAQQLGALVPMMTVGPLGRPRHEMTDVVEQRRQHDLVVRPRAPSERRALQCVLELCHLLFVAFRAACREERDDVHGSADHAPQPPIRHRVVELGGRAIEHEQSLGEDDHAIGAEVRQ